jgi:prepilin-type N-terminal cleavage/methylation domain-containing protein
MSTQAAGKSSGWDEDGRKVLCEHMRNQMFEYKGQKRLTTRSCPLVRRLQQICASSAGLSLVEVLVASAIIAIISVLLVFAFYTMGSVNVRAANITNADEQLSEDIAFGDEGAATSEGTLHLRSTDGTINIELDANFNTYTTEDGRSLQTFEYPQEP